MTKIIILFTAFLTGCNSVSIGLGYPIMNPQYTSYSGVDKNYWKQDTIGIIRADTIIVENKEIHLLAEYEHISSIGSDYATLDSANLILKFGGN